MPSIFSKAGGSKKDKGKRPLALQPQSATLPLRRSGDGTVASPRPDSAGFRKVNGYRQEIGEFGTTPGSARTLPGKPITLVSSPDASRSDSPPPALPPKYTFLPLHIPSETPSSNSIDSFAYSSDDVTGLRSYGILAGVGSKILLGLEEVGELIRDVGAELEKRGLGTPWLFSNQALDLDQARVKRLVNAYIQSLGGRSLTRSNRALRPGSFQQDLQFAKEYELAWLLRWALSRLTRLREGSREVCHGMLDWEVYEEWRGRERAAHYPSDAFPYLSALVPSDLYHQVLTPLFQLLSRFAAHSHLSGLTPHTLSSLFAPLVFDIPASAPAMLAHATFVRSASATEHLLLAFVRSQSSSKSELGVKDLPARLREWVIGYPSMLASDAELARGLPRKGAKMVRCERASRSVRAYTRDLVISSELWVSELPSGQEWDQWNRVVLQHRTGEVSRPKFSSAWRKKMAVKETLPLPASASDQLQRQMSYGKARAPGRKDERRRGERERKKSDEGEARYSSLAGKEWSMFEEGGFDSPSESERSDIKSRLQFDLTESAKNTVSEKRQTMNWNDFASSSGGFSRTDPHLAVSLTFSEPLSESITQWPSDRDALQRKLRKSQKEATPFHYDTSIKLGLAVENDQGEKTDERGRVWIEEAFIDCWADLMMGAGWVERDELTFKEANWALIEYKARPSRSDVPPQDPLADPRTGDLCIIFEERVPLDYQMAIANPQQKKTFADLFSSTSRRRDTGTPLHPSLARRKGEEQDFDRMLLSRSATKKVTLGAHKESNSVWHREPPVSPIKVPTLTSGQSTPTQAMVRKRTKSTTHSRRDADIDGNKASSFFSKARVARRVKTSEDNRGKARKEREKEHEVEFEIHSASGVSSGGNSPNDKDRPGRGQKGKDEEKWMDILIANGAKRMDRQDALPPRNLNVPPIPAGKITGLPPSPRPVGHELPPAPAGTQHTPELSYERSAEDEAQSIAPATPRASAFSHREASPRSSEEPVEDPYAHGLARRHQGHGSGAGYRYSDEEPRYSTDTTAEGPSSVEFTSRSSGETNTTNTGTHANSENGHGQGQGEVQRQVQRLEMGRGRERISETSQTRQQEIPIIAPIPTRDTIHGIVSTYGQRNSMVSYDSRYDDSDASIDPSLGTSPNSKRTGKTDGEEEEEESGEDQFEELKSPLHPPVPTFDLTPGREPSPMRYRHGEPLHFVGEEEEESVHC